VQRTWFAVNPKPRARHDASPAPEVQAAYFAASEPWVSQRAAQPGHHHAAPYAPSRLRRPARLYPMPRDASSSTELASRASRSIVPRRGRPFVAALAVPRPTRVQTARLPKNGETNARSDLNNTWPCCCTAGSCIRGTRPPVRVPALPCPRAWRSQLLDILHGPRRHPRPTAPAATPGTTASQWIDGLRAPTPGKRVIDSSRNRNTLAPPGPHRAVRTFGCGTGYVRVNGPKIRGRGAARPCGTELLSAPK